ncbi:hypothetical protein DFH29DRAFT_951535 [Suillus ampliporus]|nr:hypothetical protein DFH29DRAFT_951535 [Suillus ampliporus]
MIVMLGTTDNCNTEYTERLHIDYTKDAYRATNHKDEFVQMTRWLGRKEKFYATRSMLTGDLLVTTSRSLTIHVLLISTFRQVQTMTKHPSVKAVSMQN